MEDVVLYTMHCPQCEVLRRLLDEHNIQYETCADKKKMMALGIMSVPMLKIDGELLNFKSAMQRINEMGE